MSTPPSNTDRPKWANLLRDKYLAGEASIFVVHGNVFDHVLSSGVPVSLRDYLAQSLFGPTKSVVAEIGWSQGVRVVGGKSTTVPASTPVISVSAAELSAGGVGDALLQLEQIFRKQSAALIIPYAGTLLPAGDPSFLSNDERAVYTTLHRWSLDSALSSSDCVVVLLAESLSEINPGLLSSPRVATINVPLPDEAQRTLVVRQAAPNMSPDDVRLLAAHTSGLRAIQVERIVASQASTDMDTDKRTAFITQLLADQPNAADRAQKLAAITAGKTPDEIRALVAPDAPVPEADRSGHAEMLRVIHARKREIIEKECSGLIEFMDSRHGLEAVGGNDKIKAELMGIAETLRSGNRKLAPMGLLCVGPMGVGKTFVVKAFLKEAGLTGVALKNIRSKWNGATEGNLERVLATVKAMGPIAVVIDESDRSFGGKEQADTDGGVSSRVMARLKEFMSDTDNRGQVLFILMTNRPDRIETDLKRPGRLDRKVPFFYCETSAERAQVVRALLNRHKEGADIAQPDLEQLCEQVPNYSNADLEAIVGLAMEFGARDNAPVSLATLSEAMTDFIPSREEDMIRLMELLAAQETSRRSLLPERFVRMSTQEINQTITQLRHQLREEA